MQDSLGLSYASRIRIEPNREETMGKQLPFMEPVSNLSKSEDENIGKSLIYP